MKYSTLVTCDGCMKELDHVSIIKDKENTWQIQVLEKCDRCECTTWAAILKGEYSL